MTAPFPLADAAPSGIPQLIALLAHSSAEKSCM